MSLLRQADGAAGLVKGSLLRGLLGRSPEFDPLTLRFHDPVVERRFAERYLRDNLGFIRMAHVLGIVVWVVFGLMAQLVLQGDAESVRADLILRYGFAVPIAALALALTWAPWYPRRWPWVSGTVTLISGFIWSMHRVVVPEATPGWAYAGLMIVLVFIFTLSRLWFVPASITGVLVIVFHNVIALAVMHDTREELYIANFFLFVTASMGSVAAYGLERFTRLLYLRERELDDERLRTDELLRTAMPGAIVTRLQESRAQGWQLTNEAFMAEGLPDVTVIFADLVGFTTHVEHLGPRDLIVTLDDVFTRFDLLASRLGLEKIKTVGDAYMVVAGAPEPREDHAEAAAEMALGMLGSMTGSEWPAGEPMQIRVGMASGPVVAGVIGRQRFAYDLWGDTVNLASRLEATGEPGKVLVADTTYTTLRDRYVFSDPIVLQLKGKGPTSARFLLGRQQPSLIS